MVIRVKEDNEEALLNLLDFWRKKTEVQKGEHYDLTENSVWVVNIGRVKEIIRKLEGTNDIREIKTLLGELFKPSGKDKLIWASNVRMIKTFITDEENQDYILQLRDLIIDVARSNEFKENWIEELYLMLERWNPEKVHNFTALKKLLVNTFGELFGKLHVQTHPVMNACSRSFLKSFYEFEEYDYKEFSEVFEKIRKKYLEKVGRVSDSVPVNVEMDMMFNYFDKDPEGKKLIRKVLKGKRTFKDELKEIIEGLQNEHSEKWLEISDKVLQEIREVRKKLLSILDKDTITEEDVDELYNLVKPIEDLGILPKGYTFQYTKDKKTTSEILGDKRTRDFLLFYKNANSVEGLSKNPVWDVENVGGTVLTSLGTIINEKIFFPFHDQTLNPKILRDLGLKKFYVGSDEETRNQVERFLIGVRDVANELGMENLLEIAFYLAEYELGSQREIQVFLDNVGKKFFEKLRNKNLNISKEQLKPIHRNYRKLYLPTPISDRINGRIHYEWILERPQRTISVDLHLEYGKERKEENERILEYLRGELDFEELSKEFEGEIKISPKQRTWRWLRVLRSYTELDEELENWAVETMIKLYQNFTPFLEKYFESDFMKRFWLIAPGKRAKYWDLCVEKGIICVGWKEVVERYGKEVFEFNYETLKDILQNEFNYGDSHELWKFLKEISIGDIILAKRGLNEIIGVGVIESEADYDLNLDFPIFRKVRWYQTNLSFESPKQFRGTITELRPEEIQQFPELEKLLRDITEKSHEEELDPKINELESLINYKSQVILYGPPGTGKTWLANKFAKKYPQTYPLKSEDIKGDTRFFLWAINPKWGYTWIGPGKTKKMWIGRIKQAFEEITDGDIVFIYVGGKVGKIYGVGTYESVDEKHFVKIHKKLNGPTWKDLKNDPTLGNSLPIKLNLRGTLFPLEIEEGLRICELSNLSLDEIGLTLDKSVEEIKTIEFATFHQSYSYEEFIEGLRPKTDDGGDIFYEVEEGIFKRMCRNAFNALMDFCEIGIRWYKDSNIPLKRLQKEDKERIKNILKKDFPRFYLLIDEINRGDISRIFGELITLLEADKRLFAENELVVMLPYSKTEFGIPPNLYIIGTMNTADRSIALIDIALRRRFGFIEMTPNYEVLEKELLRDEDEAKDIKKLAIETLKALNKRIKRLYDRDHQIGHSYFLKLRDLNSKDDTIEMLKQIWYNEILPLLQEYFYDSPDKLKEVLNGKFVDIEDNYFDFKQEDDFIGALKEVAET